MSGADLPFAPLLEAGSALALGYVVEQHLRRGADLDVYQVWSEHRDCRCVAKVLRPDRMAHRRARGRLLREARLLLRLSHPHLVRAYEWRAHPQPMLILETLAGATLARMLEVDGPLRARELVQLGLQLCSVLGYLHRERVLHLDVKPSNIVAECGTAKLLDLSIARPPGPYRRGVGSRPYMAPEQIGGGVVGPATDVWALGLVLYEAAIGNRPFQGAGTQTEVTPLHAVRRLPRAFSSTVHACLAPDPRCRPSLADIANTLHGIE
jgi:eukaryotic-like serine/threonine-protein kinase